MQSDSQPPPPVIGPPSPSAAALPPAPGPLRQVLNLLLSVCLVLFLADALVSLVDDSIIVLFDLHLLTLLRGTVYLMALLAGLVVYLLIGLTPMIPKRIFLPLTLFNPVVTLAVIPLIIYFHPHLERISWVVSLCQVALALAMLGWAQGGLRPRWPLVAGERFGARGFSWPNLAGFLLVNVLVLLPAAGIYLALCASVAVGHLSDGFMLLRPSGFTVQVRKYVREDGKAVHLVPMAHVGMRDFYRQLSRSFPTNAVVLMEGVTDNRNLLTNQVSYQRMAKSLGLSEQEEEFNPVQVEMVMADLDLSDLTPTTVGFLNMVMLVHGKGLNASNVLKLLTFSPPPGFEEKLWDDLLRKRNDRVLQEIEDRDEDPRPIVVPWGVAHMPGIAKGILASGFRLAETREHTVIRFGSAAKKGTRGGSPREGERPREP